MRLRNSIDDEKQDIFLRRSPRFLPQNRRVSEHPQTPEIQSRPVFSPLSSQHQTSSKKNQSDVSRRAKEKPIVSAISAVSNNSSSGCRRSSRLSDKLEKKAKVRANFSVLSSNSSYGSRKSSRLNSQLESSNEVLKKAKVRVNNSVISLNSSSGSRRSSRLSGQVESSNEVSKKDKVRANNSVVSLNSSSESRLSSQFEDFTPLRRSQRVAERGVVKKVCFDNVERSVNRGRTQVNFVEKRCKEVVFALPAVTKSSNAKLEKRADKGKAKQSGKNVKSSVRKFEKVETFGDKRSLVVVNEGGDKCDEIVELGKRQRGVKRKRAREEDGFGNAKGWTKEQELALQRAYFTAKATPQFWKKVAKMVPGKSAHECFDKIHSDRMTPPQPRPRSRAKKVNSPVSSLSASKLLQTAVGANVNKFKCNKLKGRFSQKALRQILEKQHKIDRDNEADLFTVLESTTYESTEAFQQRADLLTPPTKSDRLSFLERCSERSKLSNVSGEKLFSPPVLKPIKNKALHDRYIDQLHCREARRKAASSRTTTHNQDNKANAIQAAKNSLIFDARDAINQFKNSQENPSDMFGDWEDADCDNDDNDDNVDED